MSGMSASLNTQKWKALNLAWEKAPFKIEVKVTMLLEENKTVIALRENIFKKLNVNQAKQKLIYNDEELQGIHLGGDMIMHLFITLLSLTRNILDMIDHSNKRGQAEFSQSLISFHQKLLNFTLSVVHGSHLQLVIFVIQPLDNMMNRKKAVISHAIIMCCISKVGQGMWKFIQIGKLSAGNVNDYDPIKISIGECALHG
ncbi:18025_t:CDS:2 [Acaulospora morrowiae]|uniref:18025_t:CDS:1 n=1 Tax=Acaulospora morrowiae TaxID=94023 RepID=A0A9N9BCW7_9GLOM|nr:18025_t:CDS:2 [Acaulospora morrowiae]